MSKRSLKQPDVPPGPRHDFFTYMQDLVKANGDLPTTRLAERIGYSHQAVYRALTGPQMPSLHLTSKLATSLGGENSAADSLELWLRGVLDERTIRIHNNNSQDEADRVPTSRADRTGPATTRSASSSRIDTPTRSSRGKPRTRDEPE
jgi:DNA-binding phage protein